MPEASKDTLVGKLDTYLAALARVYQSKGKTLEEEVLVNGKVSVNEGEVYDNWNGGTYGHGIRLTVPEVIFMRAIEDRESLGSEICKDLNKLHNEQNENFSSVTIEVQLPEDKDWRTKSAAYFTPVALPTVGSVDLGRIWGDYPVRVFLSHKATVKGETSALKSSLADFGISAFVAHEDIEPTEEWHQEIERALFSMDVLVALLTADYHNSNWTDQEVGVAIGRGVPVIAVRLGMDPYGLMGKRQGLGGCKLTAPSDMAAKIYALLAKRLPERVFDGAVHVYSQSTTWANSAHNVERVFGVFDKVSPIQIDRLVAAHKSNPENRNSFKGGDLLMALLKRWTGKPWTVHKESLVPVELVPESEKLF